MVQKKEIIELLNELLAQEHACFIRYSTHAKVLQGTTARSIEAVLHEIAEEEEKHANDLRDRILALGGEPTLSIEQQDLIYATQLKEILKININEERKAISAYTRLLQKIEPSNVILYETIEHILKDEQHHLEELERLQEK